MYTRGHAGGFVSQARRIVTRAGAVGEEVASPTIPTAYSGWGSAVTSAATQNDGIVLRSASSPRLRRSGEDAAVWIRQRKYPGPHIGKIEYEDRQDHERKLNGAEE